MHQGDDSNGHAAMMPCAVAPEAAKVTASYAEKADTSRPQRVASGPSKAEPDPFETIADATSRAARDMQESIDEPNAPVSEGQYGEQGGLLSRAVYSTSYCVGYGGAFRLFLCWAWCRRTMRSDAGCATA